MTFANFGHPASAKIRQNGNESTLRRYLATQKEKKGVLIATHAQNVLSGTHTLLNNRHTLLNMYFINHFTFLCVYNTHTLLTLLNNTHMLLQQLTFTFHKSHLEEHFVVILLGLICRKNSIC